MRASKVAAAVLIAAAVAAGMYAVAATTATSMAATFATPETARHRSVAEFAATVKQASSQHRAARAQCALLAGAKKSVCNAEARAASKHAVNGARQP